MVGQHGTESTGEANEKLWPTYPELITTSTTSTLRSAMLEWIDSKEHTQKISKDKF